MQVNRSTSQVDCQVTGLALDELELASLRGTVQDAALHVNFDTRMGRGNLKVAGPRFSGLQVSLVLPALGHVAQMTVAWLPKPGGAPPLPLLPLDPPLQLVAACDTSACQPQGEALAGSFRWERDVVRLEKVRLGRTSLTEVARVTGTGAASFDG